MSTIIISIVQREFFEQKTFLKKQNNVKLAKNNKKATGDLFLTS